MPPMSEPTPTADAFSASGLGLTEPRVGEENEIFVQCDEKYPFEDLDVSVTGPDRQNVPVTYDQRNPTLRAYKYKPVKEGNHTVEVKYRDMFIPNSPSVVNAKSDLTKIRIHSFEGKKRETYFRFLSGFY